MILSVESFPFIMSQSVLVENMLESKYYIVFITQDVTNRYFRYSIEIERNRS